MKLESLKIRNFRTISSEQSIDLSNGLTIVGPNSSGKTNILKAIEMLFTGYENRLNYDLKTDLTFGITSGQTSFIATFSGDIDGLDKEFFDNYKELNEMLEEPKDVNNKFSLYLSFASKSGKPIYKFFAGEKIKKENAAAFSRKQITAVNDLLDSFVCHYVPSSKSINDLYTSLLLPFIKRSVSIVLEDKLTEINNKLSDISNHLNEQLAIADLSHIASSFSLPNNSMEVLLNHFEFNLSDPNQTAIERKGMGIQATAMLASFLWITKEEGKLDKNTIWLIEEPESYLHPELADACHKMLEKIRSEALVVTTTHSLGFVSQDPKRIAGTTVDSNNTKVISYPTYLEATASIRRALGVRFSDYYNLGLLNIFVEGKSDREVFQYVLKKLPKEEYSLEYLRKADFLDFTGVSGMEGFMKATYEFIYHERPVVTVLDGDSAGDKTRRVLQNYLGNKGIPFQSNSDFISLYSGFALEGLFPHEWIKEAYEEHSDWFSEYSVDVGGSLQPFTLKTDKNKEQLRKYLIRKVEESNNFEWVEKFLNVFNVINQCLKNHYIRVYSKEL